MPDNTAPASTDPETAQKQAAYFVVASTLLLTGLCLYVPFAGVLAAFTVGVALLTEQGIKLVFGKEEPEKPAPEPLTKQVWKGLKGAFSDVKADLAHRFGKPRLESAAIPARASFTPSALGSKSAAKDFGSSASVAPAAEPAAPVVQKPSAETAPKI